MKSAVTSGFWDSQTPNSLKVVCLLMSPERSYSNKYAVETIAGGGEQLFQFGAVAPDLRNVVIMVDTPRRMGHANFLCNGR